MKINKKNLAILVVSIILLGVILHILTVAGNSIFGIMSGCMIGVAFGLYMGARSERETAQHLCPEYADKLKKFNP